MVCLASGVLIEALEVDGAAWLSVFFCTHNHAVTPCYWFTYGYRSMTPRRTSRSRPAFTSARQCRGAGIGEWYANGVASGSIISFRGGPLIIGSGWCSHVLKVNPL